MRLANTHAFPQEALTTRMLDRQTSRSPLPSAPMILTGTVALSPARSLPRGFRRADDEAAGFGGVSSRTL